MQIQPHVRWMIRRDYPEVLAIEQAGFGHPWSEDEFLRLLRQRNCIGMVGEVGERVACFMVYELHGQRIELLDLAVGHGWRRRGLGRQMLTKLIGRLSERRTRVTARVRETNLDAQLFFRACGFRAARVERAHYPDTGEDAYLMTCPALSPVVML